MQKQFTQTLRHEPNAFIQALEAIRCNKEKLVLYGSQALALRLFFFITDFGLEIEHIVVDRAFLQPGMTLCGRDVMALEDLPEMKRYNYLVAFQPRDAANIEAIKAKLLPSAASVLLYDAGYGTEAVGMHIPYYSQDFFVQHKERLNALAERLEDDLSRASLRCFFEQRISAVIGAYGQVYQPDHYFPADIITLQPGCVFVDCGAYDGDSIHSFVQRMEKNNISYGQIHAFEPDPNNFLALQKNCAELTNCCLHQKGAWSGPGKCFMNGQTSNASLADEGENAIVLDSIDAVLQKSKASLIKMDIEGAELQALHGAADTIRQHKPQLAISIYHKIADILEIPDYILSLDPSYRLYLRAHTPLITHELVLYAV